MTVEIIITEDMVKSEEASIASKEDEEGLGMVSKEDEEAAVMASKEDGEAAVMVSRADEEEVGMVNREDVEEIHTSPTTLMPAKGLLNLRLVDKEASMIVDSSMEHLHSPTLQRVDLMASMAAKQMGMDHMVKSRNSPTADPI